jgi:hypothetical protein
MTITTVVPGAPLTAVPVYVPPVPVPGVVPTPFAMGALSAGTGPLAVPDYSILFNTFNVELSKISHELSVMNYLIGANSTTSTPGSINKVSASALNEMSDMMSSMLKNQNETTAVIGRISRALYGISGTVAEGVATNQIMASSTLKKQQKETAETEAAIRESGRTPAEPTTTDFQTKVSETLNDATEISVQAKASGFVSSVIGSATEKASTFTADAFAEASEYVANSWKELIATNCQKPADTIKAETAEAKAKAAKTTLLGPL